MATISSPGLGSGLDINGIISKLMSIEQQPLTKLNTQEASYQSRISSLGTLQGAVSSYNTAASALALSTGQSASSKFIAYKAALSDTSIGTASAISTSAAGSYSLEVTQLATAHRISTTTQAQKIATPSVVEKGLGAGKLNLSIVGEGYFQVEMPDASLAYSKVGNFTIDTSGKVLTAEGYAVNTGFTIPGGAESISVSPDGVVTVKGSSIATTTLGTLQLATFADTNALDAVVGTNYFTESTGSGPAGLAAAGSIGVGVLNNGFTSSTDNVPRGTLSIQVGDGIAKALVIDSTNDTLDGLKSAINAAGAGVTAEIAADSGGGFRLVLTSGTAGNSGKLTLQGLSGFDFDAATSSGTLTQNTANGGQASRGGYSSADDTIEKGTLTITLGSGATKDLIIDDTNNTLAGLRDAINSAGLGITAGLTNIGVGDVRLTLTSGTLGASGKMRLSGLSGFNFDPTSSDNALSQAASDGGTEASGSIIKLNGITLTRDSNTITDALQGVTLNLAKKTDAAATLTITHDKTSSLNATLTNLVKTYNDLNKSMRELGAYNPETKQGGALLGDSILRSVSTSIRNALQTPFASTGNYRRISDLGLSMQKDGSIIFDTSKLSAATTADFTGVSTLATAFGAATKTLTAGMLGTSGTITAATDGTKRSITDLTKRRTELGLRLTQIEARYRKQFTALDTLVASMNTTSSYLTRQLANLPGSSSN